MKCQPPSSPSPPKAPSPRFILELEFVLSLSNPYYLSHLALTFPHLLNPPSSDKDPQSSLNPASGPQSISISDPEPEPEPESESAPDASKFASYLRYLYDYWRKPEYARFLTYPAATLRNLELLQQEQFRRDIIRPDVIDQLLASLPEGEAEIKTSQQQQQQQDEEDEEGKGKGEADGEEAGTAAARWGHEVAKEEEEVREEGKNRSKNEDAQKPTNMDVSPG